MTANGWSNMVEEELLPPTAGMTANGWSGMPPAWPLANDDFALHPIFVNLLSRAIVLVQEESLRQVDDEDVAGFIRGRQRPAIRGRQWLARCLPHNRRAIRLALGHLPSSLQVRSGR